jgi:GNAT superfamily N-acetyltransferase
VSGTSTGFDPRNRQPLQFREAGLADIPALREIRAAVRENRLSDPGRITAEMIADYLTTLGKGWVCEQEGAVLGFSFAASRSESIWALFVRPGYEGRGIGTRLLELATAWLFANGCAKVVLGTAPNTRADHFYQAQGWTRGELLANGEVFYSLEREARSRITR